MLFSISHLFCNSQVSLRSIEVSKEYQELYCEVVFILFYIARRKGKLFGFINMFSFIPFGFDHYLERIFL